MYRYAVVSFGPVVHSLKKEACLFGTKIDLIGQRVENLMHFLQNKMEYLQLNRNVQGR